MWRSISVSAATALVLLVVLTASLVLPFFRNRVPDVTGARKSEREPQIDPDYTALVIPPNIAPLNFRIREDGRDYLVVISTDGGQKLELHCPDGKCLIPEDAWRRLLEANRGGRVFFDVFAQLPDVTWVQFQRVTNTIAAEPVDSYLVYRLLAPNKARSDIRGIFQRDLESFQVSALLTTRDGDLHCFNCHTFHQHDPNRFLIQVRGEHVGMLLVADGQIRKINTKQTPMFRPLAYASWHPDGQHIAGTCNQFIGHAPADSRVYDFEAMEKRGDLVVYNVEKNTLSTSEAVFGHEYIETHPCWSADGKHIYYCRGKDVPIVEPQDWEKSKFDLVRVSYDVATDTWGTPEIVKAYSKQGVSCSFPRPSPCGKYVLHILSDKTTYPIHQKSSDVYLLDLDSGEDRKLDAVNSDLAESFPRWSSNGRWFSFLSNRRDGMSALPYLAYFDQAGQAHKAFVLPQEDPEFFDTFIDTYNVAELVKSRVTVSPFKLAQAAEQQAIEAKFPNPPRVDAYTSPTK
jgi:WD40-like Beta Propeller Repeat